MEKKLILIAWILFAPSLEAALHLPINRPSKEQTVPLELIIKDIDDYLKVNKPVVASTRVDDAEEELRRIEMYISTDLKKLITDYMKQQKIIIKVQKEYQMKKYGKLLEVN